MRNRTIFRTLCLVLLFTGCQASHNLTRVAIGSARVAREAQFTAEQVQLAGRNCFKGMPAKTSDALGPSEYVFREGYVLEHSSVDKIPLWVCENVTAAQLEGNAERASGFKTDPALKGPHSTPGDYVRSGYDTGHQAPAGNQKRDQHLQDETFYMSNMAPQVPTLNRNSWKALEEKTRVWAKQFGQAYELTGPVFFDPKEDSPQTATGTLETKVIGKDAVAVPTFFYKIVVVKDGNKWKSIAFVLPNVKYKPPYHLEQYIQSIRWIEQHTGLNFMPDLTAQESQDLEGHASPMW